MEKSAVDQNKTDENNNKQRRVKIEIKGGGGFAGILLLGGVAFTAAALVAATTFAKNNNNSNKRRKSSSIHHNKKKQEEESTEKTTATSSSNKIQKFEQGRNELGLLSVLHLVPSSSSPEEESSQLCSNSSSSSVIGFGATTRSEIVMSSLDDEIDVANKSSLPCEEEEQGNLLNDNSSLADRVPVDNSFGGRSLDINMGLVIDQESLKSEEDDNDNNDDEYKEDNDSGDGEFEDDEIENDEDESIEEKGEEDSEGTGDSSRESNAEAIWPQELIEGDDIPLEMKEMKIHSLDTEANKAIEELAREDEESFCIHQQNERETGLTMANHLIESKSRLWLWSTLAMGLLLLVIHSLLHNILSSTL